MNAHENPQIISPREVIKKTSLSRSTLWRLARDKKSGFPKPIPLSPNRIGWVASEVDTWIASRSDAR